MLKLLLLTLIISLFVFAATGLAQGKPTDILQKKVYVGTKDVKLPYRWLEPLEAKSGEKYPLVIFLHGAGERGDDNQKQLVHGVGDFLKPERRKQNPCFLIAPQCPAGKKWVEVDWSAASHTMPATPSEPMGLLIELLPKLLKDFPIDPKRVYVTGLSMGGYGTWDLVARHPEWFAAAAPICGGADEATADKIKDLPIWVFHGEVDTVVKPERSRNMVEALKKAGGKPQYTEYPKVSHNSWSATYANQKFHDWLFQQKK